MSTFGFKRAEDSPGFLLWQLSTSWQRAIKKALEPHYISHPQFVVMAITLWFMEHKEELTQTTIIKMSKLDPMTVSNVAQKLSELGLLDRKESLEDSRAKALILTPEGVKLTKKLVPVVESVDRSYFGCLDQNEQRELVRLFQKLS